MGKPEHLERSESRDIGLRVLVGKRQAMVSSSDTSLDAMEELAMRAMAMAKAVPEDPFCGLAEVDQLATDFPDVQSCDTFEPDADHLSDLASRAEQSALAVEGISNSEGASAGWGFKHGCHGCVKRLCTSLCKFQPFIKCFSHCWGGH